MVKRFNYALPGDMEGTDHDTETSVAMLEWSELAEDWVQVGQARSNGQDWREAAIQWGQLLSDNNDEDEFHLWDDAEQHYTVHCKFDGVWMERTDPAE